MNVHPGIDDDELEACPFCGGEATISEGSQGGKQSGGAKPWWYVECIDCAAMTDSVEAWNARTRLPEAVAKEPICYAIFNAKGEMHWSESCISKQRDDLEDELEILTDSEMPPNSEGWHIAPLYTLLSPLATITKEKP